MMSVPSWTIIVIILSTFAGLIMLVTFIILGTVWKKYRTRVKSPYKLTYSARIKSASIMHNQVSFSSRAGSLTSLNYHSDLAALEAERDARRIIEKSSVFENWWDQNVDAQESTEIRYKNTGTKKLKGRFFTHPQYHGSTKKGSKLSRYLDDENASLAACKVNNSNESLGSIGKNHDATRVEHVCSDTKEDFNL